MKLLSAGALISYGLFGLPLALLALPIYVYVPQFYATHFAMSLARIGSTLLIARVLDAFLIRCLEYGSISNVARVATLV